MGEIVRLAVARARKLRVRAAERAGTEATSARRRAFEAVEHGSGWYHGEAIRAAGKPFDEPH